jgi:tRNA (guanine37-N1)-methyltransferase
MHFIVLTIFPEMFGIFSNHGIIRKAMDEGKIKLTPVDIRQYSTDKHRTTDDRPFGGGCGMVMTPAPLASAIRDQKQSAPGSRVVHLTPQGRVLNQEMAWGLAESESLMLVCGRYEGIDERILETLIDDEISIGDYVLSGGELPAMVLMDAVARLIPEVLGGAESAELDSFSNGLLEHAHYTRPRTFEGEAVPEVLFSGNHSAINHWRTESALIRTFLKRPDLLTDRSFTSEERAILTMWRNKIDVLIGSK